MTHKKNGFLTFIFSLMPGAGEMYLGFMKQGVSLMTLFLGIFAFCSFFQFDAGIFIVPVVWFYSFFHVHNLNGLPDEKFVLVEDDYLFHMPKSMDYWLTRKKQLIMAWACIIIGVYAFWQLILDMLEDVLPYPFYDILNAFSRMLPQLVLSILLIALGIYLIKGKKLELEQDASDTDSIL